MIRIIIKQFCYLIISVVIATAIVFGISYLDDTYPPEVQAAESEVRVGQIHLQQESVKPFCLGCS